MMYVSKRESGAALIIGLIFLVLMSVLGLTSMQGVTLQERITGNTADKFRAVQNAENVLLVAEENSSETGFSSTNTYIDTASGAMPDYTNAALWSNCGDDTLPDDERCEDILNARVKYRYGGDKDTYFITVWATGLGTANAIIQSKYQGKPYEQQ